MHRALAALVLLALPVLADDKPKAQTPAEKLAAIKKQYEGAEAAFRKTLQALPDTAEGKKKAAELFKVVEAERNDRFMAAVEIAKSNPRSEVGIAALEWVLTTPRSYHLSAGVAAMKLATEQFATNPKIGKSIAWLGYFPPLAELNKDAAASAQALIKAVAEKNPDRCARGQAVMAQAWEARRGFDLAEFKRTSEVEKLAAEAEKAFEAVVKDYADCPRLMRDGQRTLGEEARQELFALRHLRVGKTAPEIEAEGVDGAKFKLSDHRGKVTVVVFWASWCAACMVRVPHEREMVEKFKGRAFILVGVNGDDDRELARETKLKQKMTWPSFWNGNKKGDGPISRAWNIRAWPTIYVLDAKGVIRFKDVNDKELDKAVEDLLKEMEKK